MNDRHAMALIEAVTRLAMAEEERNQLLIEHDKQAAETWQRSEADTAARFASIGVHPVDWLMDGEHDRLRWAIAHVRGHDNPTSDDEQWADMIARELRGMTT